MLLNLLVMRRSVETGRIEIHEEKISRKAFFG